MLGVGDLELTVLRRARGHDLESFERLKTIPGIGKVLALTILYEIHNISRFSRVQEFASYCRLVKCQTSSAGKVLGTSGQDRQRPSQVGLLGGRGALPRQVPRRKEAPRSSASTAKGKALSILAHRIGRAVYFMLTRKRAFDRDRFLRI